MSTPKLTIDLKKVEHNTNTIFGLCKKNSIALAGVTKGTLGMPEVANAMIRGGVTWLAESRLNNIKRLKDSGITVPVILIRSPHLSEVDRVVELADVSFNTEYKVIEALSEESVSKNKVHNIVIMVDLGDLREGIWPDELHDIISKTLTLKGVKIIGLGTNLTDLNGVIPTTENNQKLVDLASEMEKEFDIKCEILTAANSSSIRLLELNGIPDRINHFRIGEAILLGRETIAREAIANTYQDAFVLTAEIIEKKVKPSVPIGEIGQDAFGNIPQIDDKGDMLRCILNIGRQDTNIEGLIPRNENIKIIGASSDHLVIDITNLKELEVGDTVSFDLEYSSFLGAMTSPFVEKVIGSTDEL
nr:alanine/ornithine racemase family PLP-dependent enzyme [uncultured Aminipila sp.]